MSIPHCILICRCLAVPNMPSPVPLELLRNLCKGKTPWGADLRVKTLRNTDGCLEGRLMTLNQESLRLLLAPEVFMCPYASAGLFCLLLYQPLQVTSSLTLVEWGTLCKGLSANCFPCSHVAICIASFTLLA